MLSVLLASNTEVKRPELFVASTNSRPDAELVQATHVLLVGHVVCPDPGLYGEELRVSPGESVIELRAPLASKVNVVWLPVVGTYVHVPPVVWFSVVLIRGALAQKFVAPVHHGGDVPDTYGAKIVLGAVLLGNRGDNCPRIA